MEDAADECFEVHGFAGGVVGEDFAKAEELVEGVVGVEDVEVFVVEEAEVGVVDCVAFVEFLVEVGGEFVAGEGVTFGGSEGVGVAEGVAGPCSAVEEEGFEGCCAASAEGIEDDVSGVCEAFDEVVCERGGESADVGCDFVEAVRPSFGGGAPGLIEVAGVYLGDREGVESPEDCAADGSFGEFVTVCEEVEAVVCGSACAATCEAMVAVSASPFSRLRAE
nr:hypothetical protein [Halarchaeum acidiphilum]